MSTNLTPHVIKLQLADFTGLPVPNTEFEITLLLEKVGKFVRLQIPLINFETGQIAPGNLSAPPAVPGGYLYTLDKFIPKCYRPADSVFQSYVAASNDGLTQEAQTIFTGPYPDPIPGFIIQISNAGELIIQGAGKFGNLIPPGPHVLLPTTVTYLAKNVEKLKNNTVISAGASNSTQFTNPRVRNNGVRDSHINDAFDGTYIWSWASNSDIPDKTISILNAFVAVGSKGGKCGEVAINNIVKLTDLPLGNYIFDTSVAINRTDKNNIVASWGRADASGSTFISDIYRAVSFDGGQTWPINSPVFPTPHDFGDARGVAADKFGNFWYSWTERDIIRTPQLAISSDKGVTFTNILLPIPPLNPDTSFYDYPQICFGGDGQGNYGVWMTVDIINFVTLTFTSLTVFVPITGLGDIGVPRISLLDQFPNTNSIPNITASEDGRLWYFSAAFPAGLIYTYAVPANVIYKSPGPINENLVGPWNVDIINLRNLAFSEPVTISEPGPFGYLEFSIQSVIYDDRRQALYTLVTTQYPVAPVAIVDYPENTLSTIQNMRLYFRISRNNGQTWSDPIAINNTDFANRGYQSMALDPVTGDLVFGWYDGRNDPSFQSIEYFGAVINSETLDKLVEEIPLSNPTFIVPQKHNLPPTLSTKEESKILPPRIKALLEKVRGKDRSNPINTIPPKGE